MKKFRPIEMATLFNMDAEGRFLRSLDQSKDIANPLWASVLGNLGKRERADVPYAHLFFNFDNALVRRLVAVTDRRLLQRSIQLLYVQALLLGHHPLNTKELGLLNEGLLDLVEWSVQTRTGESS
jgi:molecular chaperone HtpG